ncbi:hypothetical protein JVU11DRAFT_5910 [Chiua virens]|nr:hypothetical protein JVU11DRAFT_5910 [Chiua virens]
MSIMTGPGPGGAAPAHGLLSDEIEQIKIDRQQHKEHVQWAQIHAAVIELGIVEGAHGVGGAINVNSAASGVVGVGVGVGIGVNGTLAYYHRPELGYAILPGPLAMTTFSEMMACDVVWETDEVEWVTGIIMLRAIIRTGGLACKAEWEQLLGAYE